MNSGYTSADIYAMQKEAEKRVFEMQRRARQTLLYDDEAPEIKPKGDKNFPAEEIQSVKSEKNNDDSKDKKAENILESLIELLGNDAETAMLTLLLVLLVEEKADESVILTLLYLLAD